MFSRCSGFSGVFSGVSRFSKVFITEKRENHLVQHVFSVFKTNYNHVLSVPELLEYVLA